MSKVFITDYIESPDIEKKILGSDLSSEPHENIEVLMVWHHQITKSYLQNFPKLKGVVRYGVGYDTIDLNAIEEKEVIFCNTPDYGTDEVSDTAIAMIMSITRGISRYDFFCRDYIDDSWQENTLNGLRRSNEVVLGVIGAGRIGGSLIRKAKAIGFNTLFFDPYKESGYEKMLGVSRAISLDNLLEKSDVISINTPLTNETKNMVNSEFISKMKFGSALINTARGEIIEDLDYFIEPLRSGKISGLALDVLPQEPPRNVGLISCWKRREEWLDGRVIINPHSSYFSKESYKEMRVKASENAKRIIEGISPLNIITS